MLCQRTFWISTAQMVAAQSFTYLLSSLIRRTVHSARTRYGSASSRPPCPARSSAIFSTAHTSTSEIQDTAGDYDLDGVIAFPGGFVSFVDNHGVMRTERAHYDPLGGRVDLDDQLSNNWTVDNVVDIGRYR